jgi:glycosyltransferase involved in cell wall biosynthesis
VVTSTLLGSDDPLSLARRGRLARWRFGAYARADAFVALSEALRATYAPAGIPEARVSVIPAGIPEARTRRPRPDAEAAQRLGWDLHAPRALFVGALLRRKGLDVLLDAWERVLAARPGARLLVAGPDRFPEDPALQAFADAVRARVARPPLAGTVTLLGRVEDAERVADLHGAADVFLFPSRMEGFGIVIAEALAAGTPVVTARIPGITDWNVRDGETGFVVPPEDPAALAERTLALFADPGLRRRLGEAGREDVRRRFTLEAAAAAHRRLYEGLPSSRTG